MFPSEKARLNQAGMTLIEIIIVISLVAFVYSVAMPNLGVTSTSEVATRLGRINADIRAAFDLAVLSGKPHRLVFELYTGDYWLESTESTDVKLGDATTDRDPTAEEEKVRQEEFESKFEDYVNLLGEAVSDPNSDKKIPQTSPVIKAKDALRGPIWSSVESLEWKKRSIGTDLVLHDIQAEHHQRKISLDEDGQEARAFINFFPQGYVEKAVLHIYYAKEQGVIDDQKEPYTIQTEPWEGIAKIENGYVEVTVEPVEL